MNDQLYRQLQKHLDQHPIPYPETETGSDIALLKSLFTEEEAQIALHMGTLAETAKKIHRRMKSAQALNELEEKLQAMYKKGLVLRKTKSGFPDRFSKMPLVIGMFEAQVDKLTKEVAESYLRYEEDGFSRTLARMNTNQMRTIPLNVKVEPEFQVSNYDDIRQIFEQSPGPFAVMNCICRQTQDIVGHSCKKGEIRETCILLEKGVDFAMNLSEGRMISKEEALDLIRQAKKQGFVLQPENNQHPHFVCCCCGCCCQVLHAARHFDKPAEFLHSNHFAEVDAEKCELCETCVERCPMDAFVRSNQHMETNLDRCIGCGACVPTCKEHAIHLKKKEALTIPPVTSNDMYKKIMFERFGLGGTLKFMMKAALGMRT